MSLDRAGLLAAWRANRGVALPLFGGCEVELYFEEEEELLPFLDPLAAFLRPTEADRAAGTPHVFAYFNDFTEHGGFDGAEEGLAALTAPSEDIWHFVQPTTLTAQTCRDAHDQGRDVRYVIVEGNCGWEPEHGIMLSWREGTELAKVSGFDGHGTNGHAYADPARDAFIYCGSGPAESTLNPAVGLADLD